MDNGATDLRFASNREAQRPYRAGDVQWGSCLLASAQPGMTVYLSVLCLIYMRGCSHLGKISSQEVNKVELSLELIKKK